MRITLEEMLDENVPKFRVLSGGSHFGFVRLINGKWIFSRQGEMIQEKNLIWTICNCAEKLTILDRGRV